LTNANKGADASILEPAAMVLGGQGMTARAQQQMQISLQACVAFPS